MTNKIIWKIIIPGGCLLLTFVLFKCGDPGRITKGNTSDSPNAFIKGMVRYADNKEAKTASVYLRYKNSYAPVGQETNSDKPVTYTDEAGEFMVEVFSISDYSIEVKDSSGLAAYKETTVVIEDSLIIMPEMVLELTGAIKGSIEITQNTPRGDSLYISVKGLWKSVWADTNGYYLITGIPAGTYTVRFDAPWAGAQKNICIVELEGIEVLSGDTTLIQNVILPPRSSVQNDSSYIRDAQVVQAILDSNGVTRPLEDFTGVLNSRIVVFADEWGEITVLPKDIGKLTALQVLVLYNGGIKDFPVELGNLINLLRLDLVNHNLRSLPSTMGRLNSLVELNVIGNKLDTLPSFIYDLTTLQYMSLREDSLTAISGNIKYLSYLKKLSMSDNELTTLPLEITGLQFLEELYLGNNRICTLPDTIKSWLTGIKTDWADSIQCN